MKRVLIIDDAPEIRKLGELALKRGGLAVETAANGALGLEQALASPPDIVLLDVQMPELDGPATLRALRNDPRTARVPVVFMTATVTDDAIASWRELGAIGVIAKPFRPLALADEVNALLDKAKG